MYSFSTARIVTGASLRQFCPMRARCLAEYRVLSASTAASFLSGLVGRRQMSFRYALLDLSLLLAHGQGKRLRTYTCGLPG